MEGTASSLKQVPESFLGKTSLCSWNCPAIFAGLRAHTEVKEVKGDGERGKRSTGGSIK